MATQFKVPPGVIEAAMAAHKAEREAAAAAGPQPSPEFLSRIAQIRMAQQAEQERPAAPDFEPPVDDILAETRRRAARAALAPRAVSSREPIGAAFTAPQEEPEPSPEF